MTEDLRTRLLGLMNRHGIGILDYEGPGGPIRLDAERSVQDHPEVRGLAAGVFLWRHPTEKAEPAWPRHVRRGEVIGWLKTGPVLRPVQATADGILRRPRVGHGSLAGYGDQLF